MTLQSISQSFVHTGAQNGVFLNRRCFLISPLQPIIAETKREGFAGRDIWVPSKSLPRTANLSREKSGPSERFLGSGRNLKSLPFGLRNYRL